MHYTRYTMTIFLFCYVFKPKLLILNFRYLKTLGTERSNVVFYCNSMQFHAVLYSCIQFLHQFDHVGFLCAVRLMMEIFSIRYRTRAHTHYFSHKQNIQRTLSAKSKSKQIACE